MGVNYDRNQFNQSRVCVFNRGISSADSHLTAQRRSGPSVRKSLALKKNENYRHKTPEEMGKPGRFSVTCAPGVSLRFSIERSSSSLLEMRSGQTATLPCKILPPSALQSVVIQWTKDGQILGDSR